MRVWCQTFTRLSIESNFYDTCPKDMKLNQSGQDMSLLIVNVPFCHEDGGGELCKLDILVVVS